MAVLNEMLKNLGSLSDEEIASLLSRLELEKSEREKENGVVYDRKGGVASCHSCGSVSVVRTGTKNGKQRYRCKDCNRYFTETSNTMLHNSKITEAQWRGILLGMVQNLSTTQIADVVGLSTKTVWYNTNKVMMLIYDIFHDQDTFVGITEYDEQQLGMSFKGKRDPRFFVYELGRLPRHHRSVREKLEYLEKAGLLEEIQDDPDFLNQLLFKDIDLAGTNNDHVSILAGKDRSGNIFVKPICLGNMGSKHVVQHLTDRFETDAILVTDCNNTYNWFTGYNNIHHEKVLSKEHANGPYSLARVNSLHSQLSSWAKDRANMPATKYLDINITFFWWLEKNKDITTQQKVDELYAYLTSGKVSSDISYEKLRNKHIGIDTKGLIPEYV